jgi:hypothetical protein
VLRPLLALALLGAGCAGPGYCHRPSSGAEAVADFLLVGLAAGTALSEMDSTPPSPPPRPPRPPTQPLFGTVSDPSGERVPRVAVTLRGSSGFVELETTTDERGRFWVPMPLPPDWYVISAGDEQAAGQTRLWLHDRHPSLLDVTVQPRMVSND